MSVKKGEHRLSYTMAEAAQATGIPKTLLYEQVGTGNLISFKVGRRRMVSVSALLDFISRQEKQGEIGSARAA